VPTLLKRNDGEWTNNATESLDLLIDTHFPCNTNQTGHLASTSRSLEEVESVVSTEKIVWAINGFHPFKSFGPDGIYQ